MGSTLHGQARGGAGAFAGLACHREGSVRLLGAFLDADKAQVALRRLFSADSCHVEAFAIVFDLEDEVAFLDEHSHLNVLGARVRRGVVEQLADYLERGQRHIRRQAFVGQVDIEVGLEATFAAASAEVRSTAWRKRLGSGPDPEIRKIGSHSPRPRVAIWWILSCLEGAGLLTSSLHRSSGA